MESCLKNWLDVLEKHYLNEFIENGGSAFKLLLTDSDEQATAAIRGIHDLAVRHSYFYGEVSASETRVDRIDKLFLAITRQMNWDDLATCDAKSFLSRHDYGSPIDIALDDIAAIAEFNGCTQSELAAAIRRATNEEIIRDHGMCKEWRTALARLRAAQFFPREVAEDDAIILRGWLRGDKVSLAALRKLGIYSRIERHNARDMFRSMTHWLAKSTGAGIVISLELSALMRQRGKGVAKDTSSLTYSKAGFLDACEVLREFIDGMDETQHCLICAVAPMEFETGQTRSLTTYDALHNRLINEVHDLERPNLLAAMVHVSDKHETDGRGAL